MHPAAWQALSLGDAPRCFLDKTVARATAHFIHGTTPAVALLVPSVAFLDNLKQWVSVVFLEKLGDEPHMFLPSISDDGYFAVGAAIR